MFILNENEKPYRFGDNGPKYLIDGPRMRFGILQLQPQQEFTPHYHQQMEENFYVLEGSIEFKIDGEAHVLNPGDFIHTEPGEAHGLKNAGNGIARTAFMLSPAVDNDRTEV